MSTRGAHFVFLISSLVYSFIRYVYVGFVIAERTTLAILII